MRNRLFFPQQALDGWLSEERVEVSARELRFKAEDRRYRVVDAVRVLREVTDGHDEYEIVGQVKSVNFLMELGAELLGTSMLIGDSAYDVVQGFLGTPLVPPGSEPERDPTGLSDEELLSRYAITDS